MSKRRTDFEKYVPYLLILPALSYLIFFIGYPLVQALYLALFPNGRFSMENIDYLFTSPFSRFEEAFTNTTLLVIVIIPIQVAIAIGLAMLFNMKFPGETQHYTLLFYP